MYIEREIEPTIGSMLEQGKVVLVMGARQVGKAAALGEHLGEPPGYISMENPRDHLSAKQNDAPFFKSRDLPPIIDEVQRAQAPFAHKMGGRPV